MTNKIPYSTQHDRNRAKVSTLLGRRIGWPHEIHTHTDGTLVVCEDKAYHKLLHIRTDALVVCGHANWRRCRFCGEYDDPKNLIIYTWIKKKRYGLDQVEHAECRRQQVNRRRRMPRAINTFLEDLKNLGTEGQL